MECLHNWMEPEEIRDQSVGRRRGLRSEGCWFVSPVDLNIIFHIREWHGLNFSFE